MKRWVFNIACGVSLLLCVVALTGLIRARFYLDVVAFSWGQRPVIIRSGGGQLSITLDSYHKTDLKNEQIRRVNDEPSWKSLRFDRLYLAGFQPSFVDEQRLIDLAGFRMSKAVTTIKVRSEAFDVNVSLPIEEPAYFLAVPHWFLVLVSAVLPALWLKHYFNRRRARSQGLCPTCGYDLRATPERCPECGHVMGVGV